ncbi:MAG: DinB family protein [Blastocatellia bacterium]|nr:DinB family protein [Blastocatellia bacterium]
MSVQIIRKMWAYNDWANDLVLKAVATLTEEQYARPLGGSYPTVRETLVHILVADWVWLARWQGTSPAGPPEWVKEPSFAVLQDTFREITAERAAFLETLTEADLDRELEYTFLSGKQDKKHLGDLLLHVVNHTTYHRGQVVNMLRMLGVTPPGTDFVVFCDLG